MRKRHMFGKYFFSFEEHGCGWSVKWSDEDCLVVMDYWQERQKVSETVGAGGGGKC